MITNFDTTATHAGVVASQNGSQQAQARHRGWLLQLERALLALNPKAASEDPRAPEAGDTSDHRSSTNVSQLSDLTPESGDHSSLSRPQDRAANFTPKASSGNSTAEPTDSKFDSKQSTRDNSARTPLTQASSSAPQPIKENSIESIQQNAIGKSSTGIADKLVSPRVEPLQMKPNNDGVSMQSFAVGQGLEKSLSTNNGIERPGAITSTSQPKIRIDSDLTLFKMSLNGADAESELPSQDEIDEAGDQVKNMRDSHEEAESLSSRRLHLFVGTEGVQAWIRDRELTQANVYSVASALHSELSESGLKLAALVLNGKKVGLLANSFNSGEALDSDSPYPNEADSSSLESSTKSTQFSIVRGAF